MAAITSIGVGSGLDLESLVTNIITAERTPTETRLNIQEAEVQASISAFGNLKSTLSAFQSSLANLKDTTFYSGRKGTSGDSTSFTATADTTAQVASYQIAVLALAQESKVSTNGSFANPDATVGAGTLTIGFDGGSSFNVTLEATDTLTSIRDAINNDTSNVGVTASLLTIDAGMGDGSTITELVLTSNTTGDANQIDITVDDTGDGNDTDNAGLSRFYFDGSNPGAAGNQMQNTKEAQDASITVDGFTALSATNVFSNVITGVSITALKQDADPVSPTPAALAIELDTSTVEQQITTFAATYNELIIVFNTLTDYDETTETRGILGNDSSARFIESQLRRVMNDRVTDASFDFDSLSYLGFETNNNGTINLDTDMLSTAVSTQFDKLSTLFTGDNGIAGKLDSLLTSILQSGGTIATKENILSGEIKFIEEERIDLGLRLEKIEGRFRLQFAALDILVSQLNQTSDFLSQQLAATAKIINRDN
jgi:flagellar hook-associated protein 2